MSALPLRDYQREAVEAIREAEKRGIRRQLVALPTGTGKTVTAACRSVDPGGTRWA